MKTKLEPPIKYSYLLASLFTLVIISPHFKDSKLGALMVAVVYLLIMIAIGVAVSQRIKIIIALIALAPPTILTSFYLVYDYSFLANVLNKLLYSVYLSIAIIFIYKDITRPRTITRDVIAGAICEYFLIAIAFSNIYMLIELLAPGSFVMSPASGSGEITDYHFIYFSVISLTTVGFGDIIAYTSTAKSFVMLESVTGIFYLAILVSRLVASRGRGS